MQIGIVMRKFTKADVIHASYFGLEGVSKDFFPLMDRLQKCCEHKQPNEKWTKDIYYGIAFLWVGKESELAQHVDALEAEIKPKIITA
jgi:hypothetical protein